jgi:hypothetical protein
MSAPGHLERPHPAAPPRERRPAAATNWFDYAVNAVLLGTDFAIMHSYEPRYLALSLVLLAITIGFNRYRHPEDRGPGYRMGWIAKAGLALLVLNVAIMAGQNAYIDGIKTAVKVLIAESVFLAMLVVTVWRSLPRMLYPVLITSALAMAWLGLLNLVADRLGIGFESLLDRTSYFTSHFNEGGYRWQAPLYSSWQISGLLRWAVPVLAIALLKYSRFRWTESALLGVGLGLAVVVTIRCEFRAAIFPSIAAFVWLLAWRKSARAGLSVWFYVYSITVPFLITHDNAAQFLQNNLPGFVLQVAGGQDLLGVLTLSGRSVMWDAGLDVLATGKYLWVGQGHVLMNAAKDIGGQDAAAAQLFARLGYHQGMLDILFIYGVVPGGLLVLALLAVMLRGLREIWLLLPGTGRVEELSLALFSLGMIAMSNCHDGFFLEHNWFYFLCLISWCAISDGFSPRPAPTAPAPLRSRTPD